MPPAAFAALLIAASTLAAPPGEADYSEELPRIAPLEPAEALGSLTTLPGYRIEQTAAEPLVTDPVAMCFDAGGRLSIVEMRGYSEQGDQSLGRIRRLTDTDGDGHFDDAVIFAEGLSWPTAIFCWDGGVFVAAAPDVWYLKDRDGDGRVEAANEKRIVYTGFGRSNVQGLVNSFRWGLDNRIHGATSSSGGRVVRPEIDGFAPIELRGRDFSFDPRTLELRAESGGAQHGLCFDDWGRKFVCSNSVHAQVVMYDDRYIARNPQLRAPGPRVSIADDGGQAPVYRSSPIEPWRIVRTRLRVDGTVRGIVEGGGRPGGYFTGATGITIYRGDAWPADARGLAIIGDVGSNIVHRKRVSPQGVGFVARRIDEQRELVTSTDIWFRPVQFANAPDGCLHILDMYREVIEHPKSLPPSIKQHLDLTSGRERGRLYRITPDVFKQRAMTDRRSAPTSALVELLAHANAWHRETAARLLYERQDAAAVRPLRELLQSTVSPLGRMHALYALRGLSQLEAADVLDALQDEHPRVREHAVRLSETFTDDTQVMERLAALTDDFDMRVRYQLAFSLGEFPTEWRIPLLTELLIRDGADEWMRLAAMSSLSTGAVEVVQRLLDDRPFADSPAGTEIILELTEQVARREQQKEIDRLMAQVHTVIGRQPRMAREMFVTLWTDAANRNRLKQNEANAELFTRLLDEARQTIDKGEADVPAQLTAIRVLALGDFASDGERLLSRLESGVPGVVQTEAIDALGRFDATDAWRGIIDRLSALSPGARSQAEQLLMSRTSSIDVLLTAVEEGDIQPQNLGAGLVRSLRTHRQAGIRRRAFEVLPAETFVAKDDLIQRYEPALTMTGDVARGREVFRKTCAGCHRLEKFGHELAPQLATLRNRGKPTILTNVLDPNREVNPKYLSYVIVTTDGRSHTGMIQSETATSITLVRAEGKTETILRSDVDVIQSTGQSLMPEGMEKTISVEAMADVMTYLYAVDP